MKKLPKDVGAFEQVRWKKTASLSLRPILAAVCACLTATHLWMTNMPASWSPQAPSTVGKYDRNHFFALSLLALFDHFLWVSPSCLNHLHFLIYHHLRRNIIKQHEGFTSHQPPAYTFHSLFITYPPLCLHNAIKIWRHTHWQQPPIFIVCQGVFRAPGCLPFWILCFLPTLRPLRDVHTKGPWASFNTWFCSGNDPGKTCFCQTSIESNAGRTRCI